jgi:hypothetical protein
MLHDLARGDLVRNMLGEYMDSGHFFSVPNARRREETLFFFIPSPGREESLFVSISIASARNPYSKWFLKVGRHSPDRR